MKKLNNFKKFLFENNNNCPFLNDSSKKHNYHQAILDVGYELFTKNYDDMIYSVEEKYGYKFALLIMLGKYNQQVENNGHSGLFINNYIGEEKQLLDDTIYWFEKAGLDTIFGNKILEIIKNSNYIFKEMNENETCEECNGDGEIEETCADCDGNGFIEYDGIEETCESCDGSGTIFHTCQSCDGGGYIDNTNDFNYELNNLDTEYYKYCERWMKYLNNFSHELLIEYCGNDFDDKVKKLNISSRFNL
jgi:hypothetical protein